MEPRIILASDPQTKDVPGLPILQLVKAVRNEQHLMAMQLRVLGSLYVEAAARADVLERVESQILPFVEPRKWREFFDAVAVLLDPEGDGREAAILELLAYPSMKLLGEQLLRIVDDVLLDWGTPATVVCRVVDFPERDAVMQLLLKTLWFKGLVVRAVMREKMFGAGTPEWSPLRAVVARG